jgi:hypothetical protein
MKQVGIIVLFVLIVFGAVAQDTETRQLGSFKGLRVSEAVDVHLKKGDKESARVEVDGVRPSDVITEVSAGYLRVHMRSGNYQGRRSVKVYVTYVTLEKISAASASTIVSDEELKTSTLDIAVASAAKVELQVQADDVSVDAASAGDIRLEGKAKSLRVEASTAGSVDAYDFECEKVEARAATAGSARINVTRSLDAQASSGGSIRYRGNPSSTNTDSSSGGSVKKSL